jgi:hypothetical protein
MPTWEVRNMGDMLYYFFMSTGVLIFIFNFKQCLIYLEPHSSLVGQEVFTDDVMNGILAKIFYFNVYEDDVNMTAKVGAKRLNLDEKSECDNMIKGSKCQMVNLNVNRVYSSYENSLTRQKENTGKLMVDCWIILFGSFLFMCTFSFIRVSKN